MFGKSFTSDDIPDQTGRVVIVTGGNTGLGKESAIALARKGAKVYMASRSQPKADAAIEEIKSQFPTASVVYLPLDLASFASISAAAQEFKSRESRLDILLNNAGVMALPHYLTVDGYEIQFATNHLGHFLLTKLLLPMLQSTADRSPVGSVRVVNVASIGHNAAWNGLDFSDLPKQLEMSWSRLIPYGMSKLANILHARSLAKRYPDVLSVSAHPGLIMSGLHSTWLGDSSVMKMGFEVMKTMTSDLAQGAYNQLYIATMPQVLLDRDNGEYFVQVGTKATDSWYPYRPSRFAKDDKLADRLWDWSENELKKHGYV